MAVSWRLHDLSRGRNSRRDSDLRRPHPPPVGLAEGDSPFAPQIEWRSSVAPRPAPRSCTSRRTNLLGRRSRLDSTRPRTTARRKSTAGLLLPDLAGDRKDARLYMHAKHATNSPANGSSTPHAPGVSIDHSGPIRTPLAPDDQASTWSTTSLVALGNTPGTAPRPARARLPRCAELDRSPPLRRPSVGPFRRVESRPWPAPHSPRGAPSSSRPARRAARASPPRRRYRR
jgi:hypothetical protein